MNIRNLLFTSMIFCAAPIVCVAPEVSLTKQEREDIADWVKMAKNLLNRRTQGLVKESLIMHKDLLVFSLNKLHVGKSVSEYEQEVEEAVEKTFKPKAEKLYEKNNEKLSTFLVAWNCPLPFLWSNDLFWVDDCEEDVEKITEEHRASVKKAIAMCSFAIKCF